MSEILKPLMTDETGQAIVEALTQQEMTQTRIAEINAAAVASKQEIGALTDSSKQSIETKTDEQVARIPEVTKLSEDVGQLKNDLTSKIDKPTTSDNNKFPRAKNGNIEWVEHGLPTDSQTATAVQNWLDEHPEATTTVQNHSLTIDKLVNGTLGYVTPEMFGAVGDGVSDDTTALKKSVEFCRNGYSLLLGNSKTYIVKVDRDKDKVLVPDFDNFVLFGNGATIKLSSNGYPSYTIMDIQSANFYIENLTLVGDADTHDYTTISNKHEFGCGFVVHGNGTLFNCKISKLTGDGMYLCNNSKREYDSGMKDGTIRVLHCEVEKSRRNGITVADNDIVILDGCYIHDNGDFDSITGVSPKTGIDVEASYVPTNCLYVRNTTIVDNTRFGFIIGNIESDNTKKSLVSGEMDNCTVSDLVSGDTFFVKNTHIFKQTLYISVTRATNCKIETNGEIFIGNLRNCEVVGVGDGQLILIHTYGSNQVIGCKFMNIALQSFPKYRLHNFIDCLFEKCYDRNVDGGYRMDNCTIIDLMPADRSVTGDQYVGHGGNVYFNNCLIINDTVPWFTGVKKTGCTEIEGSYVDGKWTQTNVT